MAQKRKIRKIRFAVYLVADIIYNGLFWATMALPFFLILLAPAVYGIGAKEALDAVKLAGKDFDAAAAVVGSSFINLIAVAVLVSSLGIFFAMYYKWNIQGILAKVWAVVVIILFHTILGGIELFSGFPMTTNHLVIAFAVFGLVFGILGGGLRFKFGGSNRYGEKNNGITFSKFVFWPSFAVIAILLGGALMILFSNETGKFGVYSGIILGTVIYLLVTKFTVLLFQWDFLDNIAYSDKVYANFLADATTGMSEQETTQYLAGRMADATERIRKQKELDKK